MHTFARVEEQDHTLHGASVHLRRWITKDILAVLGIVVLVLLISHENLRSPDIDDLDSAHHLMDGYFFRDLLIDHALTHLPNYALHYYKQYPALGFLFWPPLFPFVLGLFCLIGGAHVLTARICIACFGLVFAFSFYKILRRRSSSWLSFAATAAAVTVPGIAWSFNEVMLELPTLAMMCLAILAYFRFTDRMDEPGIGRALACSIACAGVVYTKQPAWFLYPALLLDFAVLHRRFMSKPEVLLTVCATTVLCVPLALFTLKFGHADLAQSVGRNTQLIMRSYASLPRWSIAAWTFYPKLAAALLNLPVIILLLGAMVLAGMRRSFFRSHVLWFGWFFFAYATFSYYDNRLSRHATFWWPAWIALAAGCAGALMQKVPGRWSWSLPLIFLLPLPLQVRQAWRSNYTDYRVVQPPIRALFEKGYPGNILVFGQDKQVLIALVREHDNSRAIHAIRGERLLAGNKTLLEVCKSYRVGTVLIELSDPELLGRLGVMERPVSFRPVLDSSFLRRGTPVRLLAFHYDGPVDPSMADVPLTNDLL